MRNHIYEHFLGEIRLNFVNLDIWWCNRLIIGKIFLRVNVALSKVFVGAFSYHKLGI